MTDEIQQPKFDLRKVYVKDMSFESPLSPDVFRKMEAAPVIDLQMNVSHRDLGNDLYESILAVTVTGKMEEETVFLVEVQQSGVFEIKGVDKDKGLPLALEVACPNILLPFAREAVCDIIGKGGFPQLLLSCVYSTS